MDDLLVRVLTRLLRVGDELGERAFEDAAHRSLVAIARSVQIEAARKAGVDDPGLGDGVLPFPTVPSRKSQDAAS
ncbi:hypothetical protein [Devosia rhizoryzae]|uniref:Uncharacterized protein n=1 Tax=Devosia rhizoryzae TaxID=2774137 RepID=A0ABX7C4K7_9HYPH|nr:hypothetical protein [Devosia rhizoryzae]QQR39006.1 hypothetical protein JI748_14860 [Devosia rhizoryzae]